MSAASDPPPSPTAWRRLQGIFAPVASLSAKLQAVPLKTISAALIAILFANYAIGAVGRTVIADFRLPAGADMLANSDAQALIYQLMAEMGRIRAVQESAQHLRFNLVKGLESRGAGTGLNLDVSVRVNADYKTLIDSLGAVKLEWGAVQVPIQAMLRPLQRLLRQHMVEIVLTKDGESLRILSLADDGRIWEATADELSVVDPASQCTATNCLLRTLAYKMAFLNGNEYERSDSWAGYYAFHRGVIALLDHDIYAASDRTTALAALEDARRYFERAAALNPQHRRSRYNFLLASIESASYLRQAERAAVYEELIPQIKASLQAAETDNEDIRQLLTAAYVLVGEAHRIDADAANDADGKALALAAANDAYAKALTLLPETADLRTYVLNQLGVVAIELRDFTAARQWLQTAVKQNPAYPRAQVNLGVAAMEAGDPDAAERAYVGVLRQSPDHVKALFNLGLLFQSVSTSERWNALDAAARDCLRAQASFALHQSIAKTERASITRNLSREESYQLDYARALAPGIGSANAESSGAEPAWTYRLCLDARTVTR